MGEKAKYKYQKDQNTYSFPTWQGSRGGRQQSDDQVGRSDCLYIILTSLESQG